MPTLLIIKNLNIILANCQDDKKRLETANLIKEGSLIRWRQVNLHGIFDFRPHATNDPLFDMNKILSLKPA